MTTFTGLGRLVRLVLRRDRLRLALWVGGIAGMVVMSAASLTGVYPEQSDVESYVALFGDNPALIAFAGPGYGFEDPNLGVILVNETQLFGCIGIALMSIFLVNRHTRAEEDSERAELLRASPVGRHAPTTAGLTVVAGANVLIGVLCAAGFVAVGYSTTGSIALAGSLSAVGLVFTGIAAVAAQITSSGRGTLGWSSGVLAAAFVLRAAGDIGENGLSWLSPIGWGQAVRAFADERWWTLGLCMAATTVLVGVTYKLASRRDIGSGLLPQKLGPAGAAPWLTSPLGLAFRLQRGSLIGWTIALFLTGIVYGSIGDDIGNVLEDNPAFEDVFVQLDGADLTDSFFATALAMLALIAAGFTVSSALRLHSEEVAGRAEPILAAPTSRWHWAASHLLIAGLGTVVTVAAGGLGAGASYAVVSGDSGQVARLAGASLVTVPAVLVLLGVAVVLMGFAPRASPAAWGALAFTALLGFIGDLLQLPDWTFLVSPLEHVPGLPAEDLAVLPLVILSAVAVGLTAVGLAGLRHRDIAKA